MIYKKQRFGYKTKKIKGEKAKKEYAARIKSKPLPDWYPNTLGE